MKISNKRKFQQITLNHLSDIDFNYFMKIYKKYTAKPFCFFNDTRKTKQNQLKIKKEKTEETKKKLSEYNDIEKNQSTNSEKIEIFNELIGKKRMNQLHHADEFNKLIYHYKGLTKDVDFSNYNDAKSLFDMIKSEDISFINAKDNQTELKSELCFIKIGDNKHAKKNSVENFFYSLDAVIMFYEAFKAAYEVKHRKSMNILTPK